MKMVRLAVGACVAISFGVPRAMAQQDLPSRVDLVFNRYHTVEEINKAMMDLAAAYPEICRVESIGTSLEGRELLVMTIATPKGGSIDDKPAMWIDGAVHANEVQAAEAVLYTAWYLTKAYGANAPLTELVDHCSFHLMPMVNPDNRVAWLNGPSTPHSNRSNRRPEDQDRDGLTDEDGPDDLDGDGSITQMWKHDAQGRWERDATDPRIFRRVAADKPPGGWINLGEEGIDNDGDGLINEDPVGGDDMNRNWPAGWLPEYVQGGAGPYPFSAPETRAVGDFIEARPNIAAVQSYHNAGGMILRGPGAGFRESAYPGDDVRVYDQIARVGEQLLPYYRSMVIHKDLYTVHGGFVNWTAESLGIFSFTNELWTPSKYFQRDQANPSEEQQWLWRDRMAFGQLFTDYREFEHPVYGKVLIGGMNKWASRNTPTFLLEEECHRNFAFTMYHADQTPRLSVLRHAVEPLGGGLWSIKIEIGNSRLIPTRSDHAHRAGIGSSDLLLAEPAQPGTRIAAAFRMNSWIDQSPSPVSHEPARVRHVEGVPGRGSVIYRFIVEAQAGSSITLTYRSQKAADLTDVIELK